MVTVQEKKQVLDFKTLARSRQHQFWIFQISGWLVFAIISLYEKNRSSGLDGMTTALYITWALSIISGFSISLLLRVLYRYLYSKKLHIVYYVIISIGMSLVFSLVWLTVIDLSEALAGLRLPYFIWTSHAESGFSDYILINTLLLSAPLFVWSFFYFGYKFLEDLNLEREKYQEALLLAKEAQLQMLRYQINPHFLFNSLSSIQALIYKNRSLADEMLTEFSEFLRYTLETKDDLYISLAAEIEMICKYLYIEKIRFQDKLNCTVGIADDAKEVRILSFLLQPFVENAIKHGLRTKQDILNIDIRCSLAAEELLIQIINSGQWIEDNSEEGTGISNVKARLNNAYPGRHRLVIEEKDKRVIVELYIRI